MEDLSRSGRGRIAFFGATSGIARAVAACLRDEGMPQLTWDALDFASHAQRFQALAEDYPLEGVFRFAVHFRARGRGFISCLSSVAGDRGRGKMLAYGAAKAGLTAYLDGLRHRLAGAGVFVQTIKPGFLRTRMTANTDSRLMADPEPVARHIAAALRAIPEPIFRRLKL